MKKFNLSLVAVLAMSTFAVAGGDIAPVEPMVETPMVEESTPGAFYLGLAYGAANGDVSWTDTPLSGEPISGSDDTDYDTIMLQAGYKFNPYIAVEGRYWFDLDEDVDTWGIYAKPMYPVTDAIDIYALLGYASSDVDYIDADGFSWGLGGAYAFTDNVAVFVDYTSMYDDDDTVAYVGGSERLDTEITSWNFGVTYTF
jgi:opacity protein-like surface antigen